MLKTLFNLSHWLIDIFIVCYAFMLIFGFALNTGWLSMLIIFTAGMITFGRLDDIISYINRE